MLALHEAKGEKEQGEDAEGVGGTDHYNLPLPRARQTRMWQPKTSRNTALAMITIVILPSPQGAFLVSSAQHASSSLLLDFVFAICAN